MTPRLSDHFSIFGLVFFVLKPLLENARQRSREKFAILTLKPRSHVRILIYRTQTIVRLLLSLYVSACFAIKKTLLYSITLILGGGPDDSHIIHSAVNLFFFSH